MGRVQEEMKLYRELMNNYKKQLNGTGTDIIAHCNSIILENNKKVPEVLVGELVKQDLKRNAFKGKMDGVKGFDTATK